MANTGLLVVKSVDDLEREKVEAERAANPETKVTEEFATGLLGQLQRYWQKAKENKREIEQRFLKALRARKGLYESSDLDAMRSLYGPEYSPIKTMVTETKCRNGESWVREVFFQKGEKPWDISPTPVPDLPDGIEERVRLEVETRIKYRVMEAQFDSGAIVFPEQVQAMVDEVMPIAREIAKRTLDKMAARSARKASDKIEDQLISGNWESALDECIYDVITFGTMILTGPVVVEEKHKRRTYDSKVGGWKTTVEEEYRELFFRRSPFDIYPMPGVVDFQSGAFFDRVKYPRPEFAKLLDTDEGAGYDKDAIREVLELNEQTYMTKVETTGIESERAMLEGRDPSEVFNTDLIEALKFHGTVSGKMLKEHGMKGDFDDHREYDIIAVISCGKLIRVMLNPDRLDRRPYYKAGYEKVPDAFFWRGVPELCEPAQKLGDSSCRAIMMNTAFSSGPMAEVDVERLAPGENSSMYPFRVFKVTNNQMREGRSIEFYMPPNISSKLMEVYEFALRMADDDTGIPRIAYGNTKSMGGNETASGLSMMLSQAAKGIKAVVKHIDDGVIRPSVTAMYDYNMTYTDDPDLVGDLRVIARGSFALMAREQQALRRTEFLTQTANPFDMEIIGKKGRGVLLREALKALEMDPDEIIPSQEEIEALAPTPQYGPKNTAQPEPGALPTPPGLTAGAPPPAPAEIGPGGMQPAGRENQLFESAPGTTP